MNFATAVLTTGQMGEADRRCVLAGSSVSILMENAGRGVADEVVRRWSPRRVTVLCGPGNNGGDGFVAAKYLADAGWNVRVALLGLRDKLKGAALHHAEAWREPIEVLSPESLDSAELVIDAIFGAGLSRPLEGAAKDTLERASVQRIPIVAVDIPSGVKGDTGEDVGAAAALLTVTCFRKKPGHLLFPGRALCGELVVTDIGTPAGVLEQIVPNTFENDPKLWLDALPQSRQCGNKYTRGHALISGGYPMTGAARMAARAAARVGAGLTTIAVPEVGLPIYATALTSIMVVPLAPGRFRWPAKGFPHYRILDRTGRRRR